MNRSPEKKDAKAIFSAAIEYYMPEQWEGYIVTACGDDEVLRQRVRELLDAHRQSDSFFDREGLVTEGEPVSERAGTQIGPYKLLQQIGEGGFGVVYMAEQVEPVRRKVALKIIKPGMDTKQVIARFEAERQALAMMDHPNIAKVLDAGATDSGRPYFVMELVKGVPINEFCDTNKLPNRDRLELFVTVCRAVQHAHQKGVIHRDLKPSNVMVTLHDNKPMPVIIDFGVSKAISHQLTEKTLFTAYGQMVGTPAYMSPEQAQMSRMDIDTRSDIYSLGVLLYELLTGSTPLSAEELRGTAYAELQRKIREEEAPKPSTRLSTLGKALAKVAQDRSTDPKRLGQFLRGDLDWIVLKALEKERNRRYETANGLASDIERFLNDEAVEACPPSVAYQLRKFVGRNRGLVTTASAIAVAILLGILGTTIGMIRAQHGEAQMRVALEKADVATAEKQREAQRALQLKGEADQLRADAEAQVAKQLAARAGMERAKGDVMLAALLDAEALGRVIKAQSLPRGTSDPAGETNYRRRLAADLRQCPRPTHVFFHDSAVNDARFSIDGKWIVTACDDGSVTIRDAVTGVEKANLQHESRVTQVTFAHDDTRLLTSQLLTPTSRDDPSHLLHLWDWRTGQSLNISPQYSGTSLTLGDDPERQSYPWRIADDEYALLSVVDGKPLGPPLKLEHPLVNVFSSLRESVLLVSQVAADNPRLRGGFPSGGFPSRVQRVAHVDLWNAQSGERKILFDRLPTSRSPVVGCYSDDCSLVAIQANDRIVIHDVRSGDQVQQATIAAGTEGRAISLAPRITPLQFTPDGEGLMCLINDSEIAMMDLDSGEVRGRRIPIKASARNCQLSPDGGRILSINREGHPQLWYTATGEAASPPLENEAEVQAVDFAPDGRYIQAVCVDGSVRVWDSSSGRPAAPLLKHNGSVTSASFSRDGSHLLVTAGEIAWLWPVGWPVFEQLTLKTDEQRGELLDASISPDGQRIVTQSRVVSDTSTKHQIDVWDATTGETTQAPVVIDTDAPNRARSTLLFSSDSRRILIADRGRSFVGSADGNPRQFGGFPNPNGVSGGPPTRGGGPRLFEGAGGPALVCNLDTDHRVTLNTNEAANFRPIVNYQFTADGDHVVTVSRAPNASSPTPPQESDGSAVAANARTVIGMNARVRRWDCETGEPTGPGLEFTSNFPRLFFASALHALSPDGRRFARVNEVAQRLEVILSDTDTGESIGPPLRHDGQVTQMDFCDDGRCLITVAHREGQLKVALWDTATCQLRMDPIAFPAGDTSSSHRCTISPSMQYLAIHTSGGRRDSGSLFGRGGGTARGAALSPTVFVHQIGSGAKPPLQHERSVIDVVFSPDSRLLMTTNVGHVVRIWDPVHGQLVRTLRPTTDPNVVVRADFSDDGQRVVVSVGDTVRVWEVATGQPLSATLNIGGRIEAGNNFRSAAADRFLLRDGRDAVVHDLSSEDRAVENLQRMTRVLSGRRVNELGNVETLSSNQIRGEWEAAQPDLYHRLRPAPRRAKWHERQITSPSTIRLLGQHDGDAYAKLWHLNRLILAEPTSGQWLLQRGQLLAELNRHEEGLADIDAAIECGPDIASTAHVRLSRADSLAHLGRWKEAASELAWFLDQPAEEIQSSTNRVRLGGRPVGPAQIREPIRHALGLAYLMSESLDEYEQICQDVLSQDASVAQPLPAMLSLTLLTPRSREFCDQIQERAPAGNRSPRARGISPTQMFGAMSRDWLDTLLAFRRGDFQAVLDRQQAPNVELQMNELLINNLLIRAMTHHKLGDAELAGALLEEASHNSGPVAPDFPSRLMSLISRRTTRQTWTEAAVTEILRREAEQMIGRPASNEPTATESQ